MKPPKFIEKKPEDLLFNYPADWEKEWRGMPEFVQGKQVEYAKIIVRFRNQQDLDDFCERIGQKLNQNSKCTWHPGLPVKSSVKRKYVDES